MVASLLYSLVRFVLDVVATSRADRAKLQGEVLALRRQVQVLERQVKRVRWSPGDRMIMAALRERLPRLAWAGLLVRPETVLDWHRALVRRKWAAYRGRPRRGRPPIFEQSRSLILRMARENPGWGYFRIRGEMLKLGHLVAATTIRSVLLGAGIPPAGRRSQLSWKQFLAAHAETVVAADFFSLDTIFFQAPLIITPLMAPKANAHAERWIGSCRRECLDRMLILNQRHLEVVLREYCMHYNEARPHRSRSLRPPASRGDPIPQIAGRVERRTRLGGLLSEYYCEAAAA